MHSSPWSFPRFREICSFFPVTSFDQPGLFDIIDSEINFSQINSQETTHSSYEGQCMLCFWEFIVSTSFRSLLAVLCSVTCNISPRYIESLKLSDIMACLGIGRHSENPVYDPSFNSKIAFPGEGIPNIKIRRSWDRLIFIMGIPSRHLYIKRDLKG